MKLLVHATVVMAALAQAKISTDVRAKDNSNKVLSDDQLEAFNIKLTGGEVFLRANNWFNFTVFTGPPFDQLRYGLTLPQETSQVVTIQLLPSRDEVLAKSDPNINWLVPPTTWYAFSENGPTRESININCMIPRQASSGLYNLNVASTTENHVNSTLLLIQPDLPAA